MYKNTVTESNCQGGKMSYSDKIQNVSNALSSLAGKVSPEEWEFLRGVKAELEDAAEGVKNLENLPLCVPLLIEEKLAEFVRRRP
jgi:hypothetical protein